jgi:protocatechuate 3,4-dioxygenase, alpha subunit
VNHPIPPRHTAQLTPQSTPSQTVGPFFGYALAPLQYGYEFSAATGRPFSQPFSSEIAGPGAEGRQIVLCGQVFDGAGAVVTDALIEGYQCDGAGRYATSGKPVADFRGFGRCGTGTPVAELDGALGFVFRTVIPGQCIDDPDSAPHIKLTVFMRGMLLHAYTRVYFPEQEAVHAEDALLKGLPAAQRSALLARPVGNGVYVFRIVMQGAQATTFLDI